MIGTYSNTALAWGRNVKEAALYFEYVIPMDREDNYDEELFSVLPESLKEESFGFGVVKELWDVYHSYLESQSELYIDGMTSDHYEIYLREYQMAIKTFEERYSLADLPKFCRNEFEISTSNAEIPFLALRNMQIIDPSKLTWELVLEFRKDPDALSKIRRLRHFLESNYTNKSRHFIEDDLAIKIEDYQSALKNWGFETKVGIIGILLKSKTFFGATAASLAFALSGNVVLSAASFTSGFLLEAGNITIELTKRLKEKNELKRNNPFDYLIEFIK
ncbi:MAG: hypothetical protein NT096_01145 [Proteobacteria bacterium]|nr:hypothetical protein [Pseudomonadota bacterium]